MKTIFIALTLLLGFSKVSLAASDGHQEFFKNIEKKLGHYKLAKGSNPQCQSGDLKFVASNKEKGFRLGQRIFFGPFDDVETEVADDSCNIDRSYHFTSNSVVETTKVFRCPASLKKQESTATSTFTFSRNEVIYEVKETGFKCRYVAGGSHE